MKIVCVTGMHRSGTSLVGRVINLLGVSLGPEDQLMAPKPDNPSGFWENLSISALNDDLLGALGGAWDTPPVLEDGWETAAALEPFREQAEHLLTEVLGGDDPPAFAGWKDPRTSLLLPFWRTVAPIDASIMTVRDPRDVAASLASRDGMDFETAAHLWLRYTSAAWRSDPDRLVMSYDALLQDPAGESARIVKHLGLAQPDEAAMTAIDEFADVELRHHHEDALAVGADMAAAVAVHDALIRGERAVLDVIFDSFHRGWLADSSIAELEHRMRGLREELDLAHQHRDDLIDERDVALADRDEVRSQLEEERATLTSQVEELTTQMEEDRAALSTQRDELRAQMEEERATLTSQVEELTTQMEEDRAALSTQRDELRAQMEEERAALTAQRDELAAHRDAVVAERDLALAGRDELAATLEEERATLTAQVEELTGQLQRDRAALTAQRDAVVAERDLALADRDRVKDERDHFEARIGLQSELLSRSEAELQRVRRMLAQAETTAAELERRNVELDSTLRRWRIDRLQRMVWRLRALLSLRRRS